jgi:hypothetical protein
MVGHAPEAFNPDTSSLNESSLNVSPSLCHHLVKSGLAWSLFHGHNIQVRRLPLCVHTPVILGLIVGVLVASDRCVIYWILRRA